MHNHHHCKTPEPHRHSHHDHAPKDYGHIFAFGILLNLGFVAIEAFYGWTAHSLALLADAGHNLSDVLGLLLAWSAFWLAKRKGTTHYTYGWRKASILAALINSMILLVAMGAMAWEAIQRLQQPQPIASLTIIWVATCGVVINGVTAWLFMHDSKHDINLRGAFLHMVADALVSLGVIMTGVLYYYVGWTWLDSITSLIIAVVIIIGTWGLLKQSLSLTIDAVPDHIDLEKVHQFLLQQTNIKQVHDLHIWALSSSEVALTAHLVMTELPNDDHFVYAISEQLEHLFAIQHCTLQLVQHALKAACYDTKTLH